MHFDYTGSNFQDVQNHIRAGNIKCVDVVDYYLSKIDKQQDLNAFILILSDQARIQAKKTDKKIAEGNAGKLAGMVIAIKDNLAYKGQPVTCASRILENFISPYNATVIERLLHEDAIIIGKTNMDEFAMGSSNETSYFGPVKNPYDKSRIPGGSSGGSAVAVAANMAQIALGSDTGGSIRQPAAMCGLVGLKPTYGRVSRFGLVAFASSFDIIGPVSRSVRDSALILSVIAGFDSRDSTSAAVPVPDYFKDIENGVQGLSLAYPAEYLANGLDPAVKHAVKKVLKLLKDGGADVEEISMPNSEYVVATYYILANAEASSNLSRYDGAHYGFREKDVANLKDMYELSRDTGFGEEVKRRIMMGTYVLSAGYYEAYYRKAQRVRSLIKQDYDRAFEKYDCIISPTTPTTAFLLGEKLKDPMQMYLSDIYTIPANLAGLNGISIPCARDSKNLPIGIQIMSQAFNESMTLRVARYIENSINLDDA